MAKYILETINQMQTENSRIAFEKYVGNYFEKLLELSGDKCLQERKDNLFELNRQLNNINLVFEGICISQKQELMENEFLVKKEFKQYSAYAEALIDIAIITINNMPIAEVMGETFDLAQRVLGVVGFNYINFSTRIISKFLKNIDFDRLPEEKFAHTLNFISNIIKGNNQTWYKDSWQLYRILIDNLNYVLNKYNSVDKSSLLNSDIAFKLFDLAYKVLCALSLVNSNYADIRKGLNLVCKTIRLKNAPAKRIFKLDLDYLRSYRNKLVNQMRNRCQYCVKAPCNYYGGTKQYGEDEHNSNEHEVTEELGKYCKQHEQAAPFLLSSPLDLIIILGNLTLLPIDFENVYQMVYVNFAASIADLNYRIYNSKIDNIYIEGIKKLYEIAKKKSESKSKDCFNELRDKHIFKQFSAYLECNSLIQFEDPSQLIKLTLELSVDFTKEQQIHFKTQINDLIELNGKHQSLYHFFYDCLEDLTFKQQEKIMQQLNNNIDNFTKMNFPMRDEDGFYQNIKFYEAIRDKNNLKINLQETRDKLQHIKERVGNRKDYATDLKAILH